jgi:hypothetical protein
MTSLKKIRFYNTPTFQFELYCLLLVVTPFLMVINYLQDAVGVFSRFTIEPFGLHVPVVVVIGIVVLAGAIYYFRKHLNRYRIVVLLGLIFMDYFAQQLTDYYFGHKFYDLQQNWHYIAYAIFALMYYRVALFKGIPDAVLIRNSFLMAMVISSFDELFQFFMSNRIFDVCDIAKDVWGSMIGLFAVFFLIGTGKFAKSDWSIRQPKIKDYLKSPFSLLIIETIFAVIFLSTSSLLTDHMYIPYSFGASLLFCIVVFMIIHLSQFKKPRIVMIVFAIILLCAQTISLIAFHDRNIVFCRPMLTVYKGIPLPFFDVLIKRNGMIRLVDKKHSFNQRDMRFILSNSKYIVVIGSGFEGSGGFGFPERKVSQFVFNTITNSALQIIVQKTPDACKTFNRLKSEGKDVIFIIHDGC